MQHSIALDSKLSILSITSLDTFATVTSLFCSGADCGVGILPSSTPASKFSSVNSKAKQLLETGVPANKRCHFLNNRVCTFSGLNSCTSKRMVYVGQQVVSRLGCKQEIAVVNPAYVRKQAACTTLYSSDPERRQPWSMRSENSRRHQKKDRIVLHLDTYLGSRILSIAARTCLEKNVIQ